MSFITSIAEKFNSTKNQRCTGKEETKFNTFFGVFLPSILSILGVILFLRLSVIVGQVGILQTSLIIVFSSMITFITGLSISATATNMEIKGGGAYYMISRSFGVEIGSAIGIALYIAQMISIAFYIEGFSESFRLVFPDLNPYLIESVVLVGITIITALSANVALKTQCYIFALICLALASVFLGGSFQSGEETVAISSSTLTFWGAFALFFPAVTGIEAGFAMSGELKNPKRSLPLGTIAAVLIGLAVYLVMAFCFWLRVPSSVLSTDCNVIFQISRFESLVILGIWGATLSSAIGGILAAPRTLQAIAKDKILPSFLGKGFGPTQEPRIATLFTFLIALFCLHFGNINILAPVLTMFFLISYGMLNLAAGLESLFGNPSWRPTFATPSSVSLLGSGLCLVAMLMIDAGDTLIAISVIILFYMIAKRKKLGEGWEDIRQGALLFFCRFAIYRLATLGPSMRSWRPYFLVFSSSPTQRANIVDFADSITSSKGFLTVASIVTSDKVEIEKVATLERLMREDLQRKKVQSLVQVDIAPDCYTGMKRVIKTYGLGPITPNTVVLGYSLREDGWHKLGEVIEFCQELGKNVVIYKDDGPHTAGPITIWWDEESRSNSELMIVIAHMLQGVKGASPLPIELKCVISSEDGRENREDYFNDLFSRSRMKVDVRVLVVPDEMADPIKMVTKYSHEASIIFLGLRECGENETLEVYGNYLKDLMTKTKHLKRVAFVLASEKNEFDKFFDYPR